MNEESLEDLYLLKSVVLGHAQRIGGRNWMGYDDCRKWRWIAATRFIDALLRRVCFLLCLILFTTNCLRISKYWGIWSNTKLDGNCAYAKLHKTQTRCHYNHIQHLSYIIESKDKNKHPKPKHILNCMIMIVKEQLNAWPTAEVFLPFCVRVSFSPLCECLMSAIQLSITTPFS